MVKIDLVAAKLAQLADRISRIELHRPSSAEALAADRDALDLLSFNLLLSVRVCADIASHIISDEGLLPAGNLAQSFVRLQEHGVIGQATVGPIQRAVGLRNVVAHGYERVDRSGPSRIFGRNCAVAYETSLTSETKLLQE